MKVRCGACRTEFDVPGAGRFPCPSCGTVNAVGGAQPPPPSFGGPGAGFPPPPGASGEPEPPAELPIDVSRVECPDCSFSFLVGEVETAPCPNCGNGVQVGSADE